MAEAITVAFQVEGLEQTTEAFRLIGNQSEEMSRRVVESSNKMNVSYKRLALSVAHISTASLALESTWRRVAEGQMSVVEGIIRSIPMMVSLASAIWTLVTAEKARAIASGIAHAVSSLGAALPMILGAASIASVAISALLTTMPSRQFGGPIPQTGLYQLHAGEFVLPRGASPITINVYGNATPHATADAVVDALRRARMV